jgi:hypothetical protein
MANQIALWSVAPSRAAGELIATQVSLGEGVSVSYGGQRVIHIVLNGEQYLAAYDAQSGQLSISHFSLQHPLLKELPGKPKLGMAKDIVESFVLGNRPHILAYTARDGVFELRSVGNDLSVSHPYQFVRNHAPGITKGFTTIKPFTSQGIVSFLGYNGAEGPVGFYTLSAIASSPPGTPPLLLKNVWAHEWAKGWTRFAMFQFGGGNFFLKTNTWRPNVNIDHIFDNPADGTCEIASHLELKGAQEHTIVEPFTLEQGEPYFLTYKNDGQTTLNKFYADCTGWTELASFTAPADASGIIPLSARDRSKIYLLFY